MASEPLKQGAAKDGANHDEDEEETTPLPECNPRSIASWLFLPAGYPDSVTEDYYYYQVWDTIQQVTYFVMSLVGKQAMFSFFRVGDAHAQVFAAVLLSLMRDFGGQLLSLFVAFPTAVALYQSRVGTFRMIGEILNAMAIFSEILACEFRDIRLMWLGPLLWCVSGSMTSAVRSSILQHFAKRRNNPEIVMKEVNQDKGGKIVGLSAGLLLLPLIANGSSHDSHAMLPSLIACICLTTLHLSTNVGAVKALQCPPRHCIMQRTTGTKSFVGVGQDGQLVDVTKSEAEVFKIGSVKEVHGEVLMTQDLKYVDVDGKVSSSPVSADMQFTSRGWIMETRFGSFHLEPKVMVAKMTAGTRLQSVFFPPGFPRTTPQYYEQYCAYHLIMEITSRPLQLINLWVEWSYVYGVGDTRKNPLYASTVFALLQCISTVAGLIVGMPSLTKHYGPEVLFPGHFCGSFLGGFLGLFAAIYASDPHRLPVFLGLEAIRLSMQALDGRVQSKVNAKAAMVFTGDPEVDLVHVNMSAQNRNSLLSACTGILCIWYLYHLSTSAKDAQPPLLTMFIMYAMMQALNLYSSYEVSVICQKLFEKSEKSEKSPGSSASNYHPLPQDAGEPLEGTDARTVQGASGHEETVPNGHGGGPPGSSDQQSSQRSLRPRSAWFSVLQGVLLEAVVYSALVGTLSNVASKLEPCTDTCMQFKVFDDSSEIPGTGIWPFPVQNGQERHHMVGNCTDLGALHCEAVPAANCPSLSQEEMQERCEKPSAREHVNNQLNKAKSKYAFLVGLALYSLATFINDCGLQMGCLSPASALVFQVLGTYALAFTTAASLMWASGATQLFFAKLEGSSSCIGSAVCANDTCGCYFQMGDLPSMLALAVPINLLLRLRTKTICTMRAAIVGQSYLSTTRFFLPYLFVPPAGSVNVWSALGPLSFGDSTARQGTPPDSDSRVRLARRLARSLFFGCPLIVFFPMLFSSCSLIYRGVEIATSLIETFLSMSIGRHVVGSQAMCGFYGMIFLQFGILYLFIPETWRLYYVLCMQLNTWKGDLKRVKSHVVHAYPEFEWLETSKPAA